MNNIKTFKIIWKIPTLYYKNHHEIEDFLDDDKYEYDTRFHTKTAVPNLD